MAKSDDLVKYITQRVVKYMDLPQEVRRQQRVERRLIRTREPWQSRWFGMIPMALGMWIGKWRKPQSDPRPLPDEGSFPARNEGQLVKE